MTEEIKENQKKCTGKGRAMLAYGILQIGSSVLSAAALAAIALSFCALNKEAKVFIDCVEEVKSEGMNASAAVRFCNGG